MRCLRFRQAIEAAKITTVGDAYPQIAENPAMRINQEIVADH
jgi:hypothetical protein